MGNSKPQTPERKKEKPRKLIGAGEGHKGKEKREEQLRPALNRLNGKEPIGKDFLSATSHFLVPKAALRGEGESRAAAFEHRRKGTLKLIAKPLEILL